MRDEVSYVEFVSARWGKLYRLAYLLAGSEHAADDLLQSALVRTYEAWDRVQRTGSPDAYVRRIVVNTATSDGRRSWRRREVSTADLPESADPPCDGLDQRDAIWPLVAALPPRQRAVVVLRYYEDLSEAEISAVLGCAPGTVKSQSSAALRSLRSAMADLPEGDRA